MSTLESSLLLVIISGLIVSGSGVAVILEFYKRRLGSEIASLFLLLWMFSTAIFLPGLVIAKEKIDSIEKRLAYEENGRKVEHE